MCTSCVPLLIAIASMARCDSEPLPIEPKLYLPGLALDQRDQFGDVVDAEARRCTASALGCVVRMVISAMSLNGS